MPLLPVFSLISANLCVAVMVSPTSMGLKYSISVPPLRKLGGPSVAMIRSAIGVIPRSIRNVRGPTILPYLDLRAYSSSFHKGFESPTASVHRRIFPRSTSNTVGGNSYARRSRQGFVIKDSSGAIFQFFSQNIFGYESPLRTASLSSFVGEAGCAGAGLI